jgi:6-phosphogluconolactonase
MLPRLAGPSRRSKEGCDASGATGNTRWCARRSRIWPASRRKRLELRIVRDLAEAGTEIFLEAAPSTVALSGGTTPRVVYEGLSAHPEAWRGVEVFFGDERCVPPDHPDSNLRMAREALLDHVPARVHPMTGCDPDAYEAELRSVVGPGVPRFDLVWLGLGADGHTASLFPGDPALAETERLVAVVDRPDHPRMTLTLPVLSAAALAVFLVSGEGKRDALARWRAGEDLPAARVTAERVVVLADPAAVGEG